MKLLAPALLVAAMALTGCNRDSKTTTTTTEKRSSMGAMNSTCPVAGGKVNANAGTVSYKGQEVGFCCAGCKGKFENMSDADRAAKMAKIK
ncbi:MAG TPA: hypothetical protein VD997_03160 [Phycisphaerales bacterium]|nr:hypothetical protein [Phycisphaerales bacterium]